MAIPRRTRLAKPVIQFQILHVLDYDAILVDERHFQQWRRKERPEYDFLASNRLTQIFNLARNVRSVPEFPQTHLLRRHGQHLFGPELLDSRRMQPRIGRPHLKPAAHDSPA